MNRTRGISPKVLGPLATALSAFAVAKIADAATEGLTVALIGAAVAYLLPPGNVSDAPLPVDEGDMDLDDDLDISDMDEPTRPAAGTVPVAPDDDKGA